MVEAVAWSCSRQRESRPSGRSRARLVRGRWTVRCVNRTAPTSVASRPNRARPHLAMPHATPLICRARRVAWLEAAWERSSSGALRSPCGASAQGSNWPHFWLRLESPSPAAVALTMPRGLSRRLASRTPAAAELPESSGFAFPQRAPLVVVCCCCVPTGSGSSRRGPVSQSLVVGLQGHLTDRIR